MTPENEKITCPQHQQLMEWMKTIIENMGQHEAHISTSLKNQTDIFDRLKDIQSALDQRMLINITMDKTVENLSSIASSNTKCIEKLQATVENGINKRTLNIETSVKALEECMKKFERTLEIENIKANTGVQGFLSKSWSSFQEKIGPVFIGILIWIVLWGAIKSVVFKEYPFPIFSTKIEQTQNKGIENAK